MVEELKGTKSSVLPELRENAEIGGYGEATAIGRGLTTQSFVHHCEGWVFIWRATGGHWVA